VDAGDPNAEVAAPPKGDVVAAPPNGLVVVEPPKAGLGVPNKPPPLEPPPKADVVFAGVEAPNPPKPVEVLAVAVPPPKRLPPVVAGLPKAGLGAPNEVLVVPPKPPVVNMLVKLQIRPYVALQYGDDHLDEATAESMQKCTEDQT